MELPARPPKPLRIGDASEIDVAVLRDASYVDTSELTAPARQNLFAQILATVWDVIAEHADDALHALAGVVRTVTGRGPIVVRILGGIAAGLLDLAATRLAEETEAA